MSRRDRSQAIADAWKGAAVPLRITTAPKCYIAGPMSGKPDNNVQAFKKAAQDLRNRGWVVTSPHELDEQEGLDPTRDLSEDDYKHVLLRDLRRLADQDAIFMLESWHESPGARAEHAFAQAIGIRVKFQSDDITDLKLVTGRHPVSQRFHDILGELGALHDKKAADYGRDHDPLANVRASSEWGIKPWVGAMNRIGDKMRRLQTYAIKGELKNEGAIDSLNDSAVYSIIARILLEEET